MIKKSFSSVTLPNIFIGVFATIYFFTAVAFIFRSGWMSCDVNTHACSMSILAYHAHDAFWHLAISEVSFRSFPPVHPIFAGELLTHYNYLYDFIIYLFSRFTGVSTLQSYFQVFPILIAVLYIATVWKIVKTFFHDTKAQLFTALFLFLGNGYAFIMTYFTSGSFIGSSLKGFPLILSIQPPTMFLNSQFALSLPIILLSIMFINSKKSIHPTLHAAILGALIMTLTLLKAYAGIAMLMYALCFYAISFCKKPNVNFLVCIFASLGSFIFASLIFGGGKGVFSYDPLSFIRSLFDDPNHFFRIDIALMRTTLESSGKFSPRLVLLYASGILLFYLINFGSRLIFVFKIFDLIRKRFFDTHTVALIVTIIGLSSIPMIFVQKGDFFNTMQFLYYGVFLSSLVVGSIYARISSTVIRTICFTVILITLIIPLIDQWKYTSHIGFTNITSDFMDISQILKEQPNGTVSLFGEAAPDSRISAFSGKQLMIGDIEQLDNTFVSYSSRLEETKRVPYLQSSDYILVDKRLQHDWKHAVKGKTIISENNSYILYKNTHL